MRPGSGSGSARPSGFTLVELAVALAILATAVLLASPTLPRLRTGADAAAHALADALERARLRAARDGRVMALELDADARQVRLVTPDAVGMDSLVDERPFPLATGVSLEPDSLGAAAPAGSEGARRVRFSPLGRAEGGPFRFRDSRAERLVTVDPWNGRPRVEVP